MTTLELNLKAKRYFKEPIKKPEPSLEEIKTIMQTKMLNEIYVAYMKPMKGSTHPDDWSLFD